MKKFKSIPKEDLPSGTVYGVEIGDEDGKRQQNILVCRPTTEESSISDSEVTNCSECQIEVWRSPRAPKDYRVLCWPCAKDKHFKELGL